MGCGMMTHGSYNQVATTVSRRAIKVAKKQEIAKERRCMSTDEENIQQKIESRTHRKQERSQKQLKKNAKRN